MYGYIYTISDFRHPVYGKIIFLIRDGLGRIISENKYYQIDFSDIFAIIVLEMSDQIV